MHIDLHMSDLVPFILTEEQSLIRKELMIDMFQ